MLNERYLKLEEVTMAILFISAWDLTRNLDAQDLHRMGGYLWEWSKGMETYVDEILEKRFSRYRDRKERVVNTRVAEVEDSKARMRDEFKRAIKLLELVKPQVAAWNEGDDGDLSRFRDSVKE